jgi:hypothetical protein
MEGQLILWRERTIVTFPPGSTFLLPAALVRFSFTAVEKPGWQMLISQSCSAGLHGYVANGFDDQFVSEPQFASRRAAAAHRAVIAEHAVRLYSTIAEFDTAAGNNA